MASACENFKVIRDEHWQPLGVLLFYFYSKCTFTLHVNSVYVKLFTFVEKLVLKDSAPFLKSDLCKNLLVYIGFDYEIYGLC